MAGKLMSIGETLIDFIPMQAGCGLAQVEAFRPVVGGAPANVCGAFVKLGGKAQMLTQLGEDPFGHKIADELRTVGIDTQHIAFTDRANTTLAFVSLATDGNREFLFYRNPGAELLYSAEQVDPAWFTDVFALHFCSVSLGDYPMQGAHEKAIEQALKAGALISFDPNLRLPLWKDHARLKEVVRKFCPMAHVLKISDEELEFITGYKDIEEALPTLFQGNTKLVLYTCGSEGAYAYTAAQSAFAESVRVKPVDTTGAGDAFIGSFLWKLSMAEVTPATVGELTGEQMKAFMQFSHQYCSLSVQSRGAIASYPAYETMKEYFSDI